jgi:carboxylesterase
LAFLLLSYPPNPSSLVSIPNPTTGYEDALRRIDALRAEEGTDFNPVCRLKFMDHGMKAERVIVFIHGYTNCPEQFRQLGEMFFERGYNVLITPLPYMGLADRMNDEQERLTAEQLAAYTDGVIDIAQGLGEHVSLAGLSAGGIIAAWAAQKRSDLDLAVTIAPSFGYTFIPDPLTVPVMNLFRLLPNSYQWWDPFKKMATTPDYGYPRYSTRALAEILRLASVVQSEACQEAPAASAILVITNDGDISVVNALTEKVVQCWRQQGFQAVSTYQFDASLKLEHDLIDPSQEKQRIDIVYPQLVELITH